jgi:hypothetical protein
MLPFYFFGTTIITINFPIQQMVLEILNLKAKLFREQAVAQGQSTACSYEELFYNGNFQICAVKSDTRCSDRVADLSGAVSSHLLRRLLNRLPIIDNLEDQNQWARSMLVIDVCSERCYQIPVLLHGAGLVRWCGVASGVDGHVEVTAAATSLGMNIARFQKARRILEEGGTEQQYLETLCGHDDLENQIKELNRRLPQSLEGPEMTNDSKGTFKLPEGSVLSVVNPSGVVRMPFVGGTIVSFVPLHNFSVIWHILALLLGNTKLIQVALLLPRASFSVLLPSLNGFFFGALGKGPAADAQSSKMSAGDLSVTVTVRYFT